MSLDSFWAEPALLLPSRGAEHGPASSGASWGWPPGLLKSWSQGLGPNSFSGMEALDPSNHCFGGLIGSHSPPPPLPDPGLAALMDVGTPFPFAPV